MQWIALAYSLPSQPQSTQRVALWRRLRRLGAVSPAGGLYLLPAQPECIEAFQWLVQEIQQAQGDALACLVERVYGLSEQQVVDLFNAARQEEYEKLDAQLVDIEDSVSSLPREDLQLVRDTLQKLRRQIGELDRIDYFHAPARGPLQVRLTRLEQMLAPEIPPSPAITLQVIDNYVGRRWVTRPRPHVDRLACAWFIRKFVDPQASIRYADTPAAGEVAFDMQVGEFSHHGSLCAFEVMLLAFQLAEPALHKLAEIVHEIDLREGRSVHTETAGIDALLDGWRLIDMPDHELERQGVALFEGLYKSFTRDL